MIWVGKTWDATAPHLVTVQHYPGACLVEGTTLSEGRGTALPFEIVGASGLDGEALAAGLNTNGWPGVRFRPHTFKPAVSKLSGIICGGVQAHITDSRVYEPLNTWLAVLQTIYRMVPFTFVPHFEALIGVDGVRQRIEANDPLEDIIRGLADLLHGVR